MLSMSIVLLIGFVNLFSLFFYIGKFKGVIDMSFNSVPNNIFI